MKTLIFAIVILNSMRFDGVAQVKSIDAMISWQLVTRNKLLRSLTLTKVLESEKIKMRRISFRDGGSFGFRIELPSEEVVFILAHAASKYIDENNDLIYKRITIGPFCDLSVGVELLGDHELVNMMTDILRRSENDVEGIEVIIDSLQLMKEKMPGKK